MTRISQDRFKIFISHKHADAPVARNVAKAIESLAEPGKIECWVSGKEILAGMDWRTEIRSNLADSHMLLLLFTTPERSWDWCLYEVGLYMRFDASDVLAVVCLFDPATQPPGPLQNVQGIPAETDKLVENFLKPLCTQTYLLSDNWLVGPLNPDPNPELLRTAAETIASNFGKALTQRYHPCHRVVLEWRSDEECDADSGIPLTARVVEGRAGTSNYTLSLFRSQAGDHVRTWGDLVKEVGDGEWRTDLDRAYADALNERLTPPTESFLTAWTPASTEKRCYRPLLYAIERGPQPDRRPHGVTIVLTRCLEPARGLEEASLPQTAASEGG